MINQAVSIRKSPYNEFDGYNKNPQFVMNRQQLIPQQTEEEKQGHKLAYSIGISALVVGFGLLGLMRGTPKNLTKYLEKMKEFIEQKIEKSRHNKSLKLLNKGYNYALNKVNSLILKSESINNFTSLKDAGFKYIMDKTKFTRKIHQGITKLFKKASHATVKTSWANTIHQFKKNFTSLDKIDSELLSKKGNESVTINGISKTVKEWVSIIKKDREIMLKTLGENSSSSMLSKREQIMQEATNNLDKLTLATIKRYKNPRLYNSFVADDFIRKHKENMLSEMLNFRKIISISPADKQNFTINYIKKAENILIDSSPEILKNIGLLKSAIKNNISGKEIALVIDEIIKTLPENKVKPKNIKKITGYLNQAKTMIQSSDSGKMQEMLAIYKELAPNDYKKILKEMNASIKALDHSIDTEAVQYFDKVRDLQIGSAPTDVLSIVGSGAYIGYALNETKNKDEKYSIMLKEGIPVLTAVGTSLYCTARLVSGSKAMLLGLLSGWLMGQAGIYTDNLRKKYFPANSETTPKAV